MGTSAGEVLHFVRIPPDPSDRNADPVFISASRISPTFSTNGPHQGTGIQQILLLPRVSKACILCNGTVTFYSLPELSPAFGTTQISKCSWIGGVDMNEPILSDGDSDSDRVVTVLLSLRGKIQVIRIDDSRPVALRVRTSALLKSLKI